MVRVPLGQPEVEMKRLHSYGSLTEEDTSEQDDSSSLRSSWSLVSEKILEVPEDILEVSLQKPTEKLS